MIFPRLFQSYFLGGFECSTHRRHDGRRLDLLAATQHHLAAGYDYHTLLGHGINTVRDGLRWYLIETSQGRYDWSSFVPMLQASRELNMQVIWDLCHYGWPDAVNIWAPAFVGRFAAFAKAVAQLIRNETDQVPFYCPINEISYWAWAGGEVAQFNPLAHRRGSELKRQLVRATIAAIEAIWDVDARARIVHAEPVIYVTAHPKRPRDRSAAERYRLAQFEAWDMLTGRLYPELGGRPAHLDIAGVNYYSDNQWFLRGRTIPPTHALYRPFRELVSEVYRRYARPILIAETGAEDEARQPWLSYVASEVYAAVEAGVPVAGICLYPIVDYPGWRNGRHCRVGLLGRLDEYGQRPRYAPLVEELTRQQTRFASLLARAA
jgi:beta-glucosidase/6-phospho-beta-glucosidase/beta-galactosidase